MKEMTPLRPDKERVKNASEKDGHTAHENWPTKLFRLEEDDGRRVRAYLEEILP